MKIEFQEAKWGIDIQLTPETPEETSQLARFALNAKAEKASIYLSFSGAPVCYISMMKVKETVQKNSISPKTLK
jgi:hypothetical protein